MNRVNERIVVIKLVIGVALVNVLSMYAPQAGRTTEELKRKINFGNNYLI